MRIANPCAAITAVAFLAGLWIWALPMTAAAQAAYPTKPVRMIVPFPPGGGADNLARAVTPALSEALGQQVVVENRPGAGGNVGSEVAARAAPDGYTVLYGTNGTFGINHALYARTGFDPIKDFHPVGRIGRIGVVLVVHPEFPAKSVKDLIAHLKAHPGKVTFGSAGNGTTSHIAGEMFKMATDTDMVHVPYKGNAPAMVDLMAGRVDLMLDVMPSAYPRAKAGKLRALAVTTLSPVAMAPDLPTLDSLGLKGFDVSAWDGLWVPAGTPKPVIDSLNAALRKALADSQTRERLLALGSEPVPGSPEDLAGHVKAELPKWAEAVKRSGAKID